MFKHVVHRRGKEQGGAVRRQDPLWARETLQPLKAELDRNVTKTFTPRESGICFLDEIIKNQPVPLPTGNPKPSEET